MRRLWHTILYKATYCFSIWSYYYITSWRWPKRAETCRSLEIYNKYTKSAFVGSCYLYWYLSFFFETLSRKFKFHYNAVYFTLMAISRWILLRTRNVSNKICRENQNTHFESHNFLYEIMSKNMVEPERPQTIWRIRVECCISKVTRAPSHAGFLARTRVHSPTRIHTHTEKYIIFISFPRQEWFRPRASVLLYAYIACLVRFWHWYGRGMSYFRIRSWVIFSWKF